MTKVVVPSDAKNPQWEGIAPAAPVELAAGTYTGTITNMVTDMNEDGGFLVKGTFSYRDLGVDKVHIKNCFRC